MISTKTVGHVAPYLIAWALSPLSFYLSTAPNRYRLNRKPVPSFSMFHRSAAEREVTFVWANSNQGPYRELGEDWRDWREFSANECTGRRCSGESATFLGPSFGTKAPNRYIRPVR